MKKGIAFSYQWEKCVLKHCGKKQHAAFWGMNHCIDSISGKRWILALAFVSIGLLLLDELENAWQMQIYKQESEYKSLF